MKIKRRIRPDNGVNLTPLIDVVFLLLIFFMVTTTFKRESQLALDLPQASVDSVIETATLVVAISADGTINLNGHNLRGDTTDDVIRGISELPGLDTDGLVTVEADRDATHQSVMTVLDALGRAGFNQVQMATMLTK